MRKGLGILLIAIWLICCSDLNAQVYDIEFGVPILDTLVFPSSEFHATKIIREKLKGSYKKKKYYGETEGEWEDPIDLIFYSISDSQYVMEIPPLEPN